MRGYKIQGCQSVVIILWFLDTDVFSDLTGHELSDITISSWVVMMTMVMMMVASRFLPIKLVFNALDCLTFVKS